VSSEPLSYRQRQAAETRVRITRAARHVFTSRGYRAATIAEIATAAGVAIPTVYKLYRNKRALLTAVADAWEPQFVPAGLESVPDGPEEAIAFWAHTVRRQWETGLDIGLIYAGAASVEPEVLKELQPRLAAREAMIQAVCGKIEPALPDGLGRDAAGAIISALTLPEVYRELVRDRGWTPHQFEMWLERTLASQLVDVPARIGPRDGASRQSRHAHLQR
jgi:AcrR family transcriptional regulator